MLWTPEKMAKEAQASIQARFEKIGTSSASTVCLDVGNYAFPDINNQVRSIREIKNARI